MLGGIITHGYKYAHDWFGFDGHRVGFRFRATGPAQTTGAPASTGPWWGGGDTKRNGNRRAEVGPAAENRIDSAQRISACKVIPWTVVTAD